MKRRITVNGSELKNRHPGPVEQDTPLYAQTRRTMTWALLLAFAVGLVLMFEYVPPIHVGEFFLILARIFVLTFFVTVVINLVRPGTSRTWKILGHIAFVLVAPLFATSPFSRPLVLFLFTIYFVWLALKVWPAFKQEGFVWGLFVLAGISLAAFWVWTRCVVMI